MQNPFGALRQAIFPAYLGVDIGTTSVKMVEMGAGKELPRILNYGMLESKSSLTRANSVFQTSSLKLFDKEIVGILKLLISRMKPRTRETIASLPGFAAFMTIVDFPAMNPADLTRALSFKAKEYIPLPLSEVALDWMKVGEYQDDKGFTYEQILLISIPQEQIKKYQEIFAAAGLRLKALEIESLSMVRSVTLGDPTPTLIVDIGSRTTGIIAADKGELRFAAHTDFAGASLTQALAASLGVNPLRAEELKRERGILATGPQQELSTIMMPFLDAIMNEVKRFAHAYENRFAGAKKFERIILAGGGANLLGIGPYAANFFGIPAAAAAPFARIEYASALEPLLGDLGPPACVALGLGIREFI